MSKDPQINHDAHNELNQRLADLRRYVGLPDNALDHLGVIAAEHRFDLDVAAELRVERAVHALDPGVERYRDRATAESVAVQDMDDFINTDWSKNALSHPSEALPSETPVLHRATAPFAHQCDPCGGHGHYTCSSCNGHGEVNCSGCFGRGWNSCTCRNGRDNCYGCGGSGTKTVSRTVQRGNWQEAVWETVRCGSCGGSGLGHNCGRCNGTSRATCYGCGGRQRVNCNGCGASGRIGCRRCGRSGTAVSQLTLTAIADLSTTHQTDPDDPLQETLFPGGIPLLVDQPGFEYTRDADPQAGKTQQVSFKCLGRTARAHDDDGALALSWGSHRTLRITDRFKGMLWSDLAPLAENGDYQKLARIPAGRDILALGIGAGKQKDEAQSRIESFLPNDAKAVAISAGADIDKSVRRGDMRRGLWLALLTFGAGFASWGIASVNIGLAKAIDYLESETGNVIGEIEISDGDWLLMMLVLGASILITHLWRKKRRRRRRFRRIVGDLLSGRPRLRLGVLKATAITAVCFALGISLGTSLMPILQGVPQYACPVLETPDACLAQSWSIYGHLLEAGLARHGIY